MKKIDFRHRKVRLRKTFFPTLLVTAFLWVLVGMIIYFVDPDTSGSLPLFFVIFFLATFFTLATLFANTRRGFIATTGLTIFLALRYLEIGSIVNALLLLGLGITVELYFSRG